MLDLAVHHCFFTLINPTQTNPELLLGTKFSRSLVAKRESKVVCLKGIGFPYITHDAHHRTYHGAGEMIEMKRYYHRLDMTSSIVCNSQRNKVGLNVRF